MFTGAMSWFYNSQLYSEEYYPAYNLGAWLTVSSSIGGSVGLILGGIISDWAVTKLGTHSRLWVLAGSQVS